MPTPDATSPSPTAATSPSLMVFLTPTSPSLMVFLTNHHVTIPSAVFSTAMSPSPTLFHPTTASPSARQSFWQPHHHPMMVFSCHVTVCGMVFLPHHCPTMVFSTAMSPLLPLPSMRDVGKWPMVILLPSTTAMSPISEREIGSGDAGEGGKRGGSGMERESAEVERWVFMPPLLSAAIPPNVVGRDYSFEWGCVNPTCCPCSFLF